MDFTTSIRFDKYSVGSVKLGVLLQGYTDGKIRLDEEDEPFRDIKDKSAYSDTILILLKGIPFPESIILQGSREYSTVASGGRTLATIIHYLGGMPNISRTSQYSPIGLWAPILEFEIPVTLFHDEYRKYE